MNSNDHMNIMALNQNILMKCLVIGGGVKEGEENSPIVTPEGLQVYLNGTHRMPESEDLDKWFTIGSMLHPYAMGGMPGLSGDISYEFWVTKNEYIIVVRVKLDESTNGLSESAGDILTLVKRDTLPENIKDTEESYSIISREMIICHFDILFKFHENIKDLNDWGFEDDTLYSFVQYYFDLKNV